MRILLLPLLCLTLLSLAPRADDEVVYPAPEGAADVRHDDKLEFLRGALERTKGAYGDYRIRPASTVMNKARQLVSLSTGQELTLTWSGTTLQMERDFLPVRIPLRKGLGGYRISLIAQERQAAFDQVRSLQDLRRFVIGQGKGWSSADVLQEAGFPVVTSNYDSLFRMVGSRRIDMFPRGLHEAFEEYEANRAAIPNLAVEERLVIRYDNPYYFFVSRQNVRLARRLEQGLRLMIKDGSFDEIFWRHNGESIRKANLAGRRVIAIPNRQLPPLTPLADKSLWFDPMAPLPK